MVKKFGDFRFDDERRSLSKGGQPVRVVGQALDVLALLLARPGELVTREEIRSALWPGSHVEFDHSLDVIMSRVRSVLGDDGKGPRYVDTVPRKGYRFIEPVRLDAPSRHSSRGWPRRVGTYAAVAILAALVAILFARTRYEPFVQSRQRAASPPARRDNGAQPSIRLRSAVFVVQGVDVELLGTTQEILRVRAAHLPASLILGVVAQCTTDATRVQRPSS